MMEVMSLAKSPESSALLLSDYEITFYESLSCRENRKSVSLFCNHIVDFQIRRQ